MAFGRERCEGTGRNGKEREEEEGEEGEGEEGGREEGEREEGGGGGTGERNGKERRVAFGRERC